MDFFERSFILDDVTPLTAYRSKVRSVLSPDVYLVPNSNTGKFKDLISGDIGIGTNTTYGGKITSPTTNAIVGEPYNRFNGSTAFLNLLPYFPSDIPSAVTILTRMRIDSPTTSSQFAFLIASDGNNETRAFTDGSGAIIFRTKQSGTTVNITSPVYDTGVNLSGFSYDGTQQVVRVNAETPVTGAMGGSPVNAMTTAFFLAASASPVSPMTADVMEIIIKFGSAISTSSFNTIYNKLIG